MSEWIAELTKIGYELFGRSSPGEMWALVVVCVFAVFFLYGKLAQGFQGKGQHSLFVLVPSILLMGLAAVAARLYWSSAMVCQLAAVLVVFLAVVLPLTCRLEKTGYFNAMIPWVVTALLLAAILYLEPIVMKTLSRGVEKGSLLEREKNQANAWDKL